MTADFRLTAYAVAKRPERQRPRNGPVLVIKVVPMVWQRAMLAADGDGSRIQIIDATTVIVTNKGRA